MSRCETCVLPSHAIPILADGRCSLCHVDNGKQNYLGEQALAEILARHRKLTTQRGVKWNCVLPVSGGKDSCYMLHQLVTRYDMTPLVFHYSHGFSDVQAKRNVENAARLLGVDLVVSTDDRLQRHYLTHNLLRLSSIPEKRLGRVAASLLCTGCREGYFDQALRLAIKQGVSLLMLGGSPVEANLQLLGLKMAMASTRTVRQRRLAVVKMLLREIFEVVTTPVFYDPRYYKNVLRHTQTSTKRISHLLSPYLRSELCAVERASFFNYVEWDEEKIVSTLQKDLGWQQSSALSTTTRFDCKIHPLLDGLRQRYLDLSEKEVMYSIMVRKGILSRDEALKRLQVEIAEERLAEERLLEDILTELGISDRFEEIHAVFDGKRVNS